MAKQWRGREGSPSLESIDQEIIELLQLRGRSVPDSAASTKRALTADLSRQATDVDQLVRLYVSELGPKGELVARGISNLCRGQASTELTDGR